VVQPFYIKFADIEQSVGYNISSFEHLLTENYSFYYEDLYWVYFFTTNRGKDTIMDVLMLTKNQASTIANWRCQFLDVDSYRTKDRQKTSKKHPDAFIFNCNKQRFKNADDPE